MREIKNREINNALHKLHKFVAIVPDEHLSPDMFTCVEEFWEYIITFWRPKIRHFAVDYNTIGPVKMSVNVNSNNYGYIFVRAGKSEISKFVNYKTVLEILENKTNKFVINLSPISNIGLTVLYLAPFLKHKTTVNKSLYTDGNYTINTICDNIRYTHKKIIIRSLFSGAYRVEQNIDNPFEIRYNELVILVNKYNAEHIKALFPEAILYMPSDEDLMADIPVQFETNEYTIWLGVNKKIDIKRETLDKKYWPYS